MRATVNGFVTNLNLQNGDYASPGKGMLALIDSDPIFAWMRLAQRIPVRVRIDDVPSGVVLAAGMTATVENDDRTRGRIGALHFSELGSLLTY